MGFYAKKLELKCLPETVARLSHERYLNNIGGKKVPTSSFLYIDTFEKAYICGLIYADGNTGANRISVTAFQDDIMEVEDLFNTTGKWSPIKNIFKKRSTKPLMTLNAYNTELQSLFNSLGYNTKCIGPHTFILNKIPEELHYAFWRGFFDGDGHCSAHGISFSADFKFNWVELGLLCDKLTIVYSIELRERFLEGSDKTHRCSVFHIRSKENVYKMYNFLYSDRPRFGFTRKHNQLIKCLTYKGKRGNGKGIRFIHHDDPNLKYW